MAPSSTAPLPLMNAWEENIPPNSFSFLLTHGHRRRVAQNQACIWHVPLRTRSGHQDREYGKSSETNAAQCSVLTRRALTSLYAHVLRIPVQDSQHGWAPRTYLGAMLSMSLAHDWLARTLNMMHLHSNPV